MDTSEAGQLVSAIHWVGGPASAIKARGAPAKLPLKDYDELVVDLRAILTHAVKMGLVATKAEVSRALDIAENHVDRSKVGFAVFSVIYADKLRGYCASTCTRAADELKERLVLVVPPVGHDLYTQSSPLFGKTVFDAFPSANEDIGEAGKCLALDRGTACVMHLNRAQEVALKALARTLGVPDQNDWGAYLRGIAAEFNARMRASGKRTADEQFYAEAATAFDNLKFAWRNPTMHPEKTYTIERATDIFDAARRFMQHLATRISE